MEIFEIYSNSISPSHSESFCDQIYALSICPTLQARMVINNSIDQINGDSESRLVICLRETLLISPEILLTLIVVSNLQCVFFFGNQR